MGMTEAIAEKIWVCYTLDYLFYRRCWKNHIAFKGGTSLSKAYGLIKRFLEDINIQWIEKKGVPAQKVGRQRKFKISEIDE